MGICCIGYIYIRVSGTGHAYVIRRFNKVMQGTITGCDHVKVSCTPCVFVEAQYRLRDL